MDKVFVACLGIGKGTWGHVARLATDSEWKEIVLVGTEWAQENFETEKDVMWIIINNRRGFDSMVKEIREKLPDEPLVVSLISGSGKEHLALLSVIRRKDTEHEFIVLTADGVKLF